MGDPKSRIEVSYTLGSQEEKAANSGDEQQRKENLGDDQNQRAAFFVFAVVRFTCGFFVLASLADEVSQFESNNAGGHSGGKDDFPPGFREDQRRAAEPG